MRGAEKPLSSVGIFAIEDVVAGFGIGDLFHWFEYSRFWGFVK